MKRMLISTGLLATALSCYAGTPPGAIDDNIAAAKGAIKDLSAALKSELGKAIQAGGPVAAIEVCNTQAMPITHTIAEQHGLDVGRVSLKNRNPANAPNEWQAQVLESFDKQRAAGAEPAELTWTETVETAAGTEFRYMQAIPTAGVCLACHGTKLAPDISEVLAEKYPGDRATGFAQGDIRGAFVVTRKLVE